jgi:hypothetical protein
MNSFYVIGYSYQCHYKFFDHAVAEWRTNTSAWSVELLTGLIGLKLAPPPERPCPNFDDLSFHSRDLEYFRFTVRHFDFACRPMSDYVGSSTIGSGMVENVGKAFGISTICLSIPEI